MLLKLPKHNIKDHDLLLYECITFSFLSIYKTRFGVSNKNFKIHRQLNKFKI